MYSLELLCATLPEKKPDVKKATILRTAVTLKAPVITENFQAFWADVSEMTHFFDGNGKYSIAYSDNKYVYITRLNNAMKAEKTLKIKKKYPLLGDVVCDDNNNYYIIWGQNDIKGKGNVVTMAVSKYQYNGKFIKTTTFKTRTSAGDKNHGETRSPFDAGNCSTIISNGVLICNYARGMYSGHQSNGIIAVNTSKMTKNTSYHNYVSHSFDQRVIALKNGEIEYGNLGDAYPRGFNIENSEGTGGTYFHFYGSLGYNITYSQLGNICEMSTGIIYSGTSTSSMTSASAKECKNLFIQLADKEQTLAGSSSRKGTAGGQKYTDKGIVWLTNYDKYDARNPQMIKTDDDRLVILWEKYKRIEYIDTYYTTILKKYTCKL